MSTIKKLDPRVRRNQYTRKEKARAYQARAGWQTQEALAAYAAAEVLIESIGDSKKTGKAKDALVKRVELEYESNKLVHSPDGDIDSSS